MSRKIRLLLMALILSAPTTLAIAGGRGDKEPPADAAQRLLQTGRALVASAEFDRAILALMQAHELAPAEPRIYEALADAYLGQGIEPMAVIELQRAVDADSTRMEPRLSLAGIHMQARRYAEAARVYQGALKLQPTNDVASMQLGKLFALAKQPAAAAAALAPYVARHPEDLATAALRFESLEAASLFQLAAAAAESTLAANPSLASALRTAARAEFALNAPEQTVSHLLRLEQTQPLEARDELLLGRAFLQLRNDAAGLPRIEKAMAADADAALDWSEVGAAYMRSARWSDAAAAFGRKIAQDSTAVGPLINYALCKQQLKEYGAAASSLRRATTLKPDYVKAYASLATTYVLMDSVSAARRAYAQVIRLAGEHPGDCQSELFEAYRYVSVDNLMAKNWTSAIDTLNKAVAFHPEDIELRLYRAQAHFALNHKDAAKREFETVLKMQPDNKQARKALDLLAQYN